MRALTWLVFGLVVTCGAKAAYAQGADPTALFNEAVRLDLSGEDAAPRAFELYRRAAEAGLPAAEFNVAVMFDSGRGTAADMTQAATWYARAATHGNQRAAYNLGQLYDNGQGVPQNVDLARAWFAASGLAAAKERMSQLRAPTSGNGILAPPRCVVPAPGGIIALSHNTTGAGATGTDGIELVWTSTQQPEPVRFFVELREVTPAGSTEAYSGFVETSAVLVSVADRPGGSFAWRVTALGRKAGGYMASEWAPFSLASQ